jgi:hypothetical protein
MKKTKNKTKNKKNKAAKKATVLGGAAKSLKKLRKNSVGKLSTTQKVLAGTALGILGVRLLVKKMGKPQAATAPETSEYGLSSDVTGAEANLTALEE